MKIRTEVRLTSPEPQVIAWRSGAPEQRVTLTYQHDRDAVEAERHAALALVREIRLRGVVVEQTGEGSFATRLKPCGVRGCDQQVAAHPFDELHLRYCPSCQSELEIDIIERDEWESWAD